MVRENLPLFCFERRSPVSLRVRLSQSTRPAVPTGAWISVGRYQRRFVGHQNGGVFYGRIDKQNMEISQNFQELYQVELEGDRGEFSSTWQKHSK